MQEAQSSLRPHTRQRGVWVRALWARRLDRRIYVGAYTSVSMALVFILAMDEHSLLEPSIRHDEKAFITSLVAPGVLNLVAHRLAGGV
jgi:hypothetical protein